MTSKKCLICGKELTPKNWCQRYCSPECYEESNRRRSAKKNFRKVKCECCGKEMTTTSAAENVMCRACSRSKKSKSPVKQAKTYKEIREFNRANPLKSEYRGQRCGGNIQVTKPCLILPTTKEN